MHMSINILGRPLAAAACLALSLSLSGCAVSSGSASALSSLRGSVSGSGVLSQAEVAAGLKEALNIGISTGVKALSASNGYYNDLATRIGLPPEAKIITQNVAKLPGGQALVTKVVKNINAAASDAATNAVPIFASALTSMTINDAMGILKSKGTAATDYFKTKTKAPLKALFGGYIDKSVNKKLIGNVSPQSCWNSMTSEWNEVASSTVGRLAGLTTVKTNLTDYLTDKAVDGIYYKVGEQEKKIRSDARERTSALLKKVFGRQ